MEKLPTAVLPRASGQSCAAGTGNFSQQLLLASLAINKEWNHTLEVILSSHCFAWSSYTVPCQAPSACSPAQSQLSQQQLLKTSSVCECDIHSSTFLPKRLKIWTVHSSVQDRRDLTGFLLSSIPQNQKPLIEQDKEICLLKIKEMCCSPR